MASTRPITRIEAWVVASATWVCVTVYLVVIIVPFAVLHAARKLVKLLANGFELFWKLVVSPLSSLRSKLLRIGFCLFVIRTLWVLRYEGWAFRYEMLSAVSITMLVLFLVSYGARWGRRHDAFSDRSGRIALGVILVSALCCGALRVLTTESDARGCDLVALAGESSESGGAESEAGDPTAIESRRSQLGSSGGGYPWAPSPHGDDAAATETTRSREQLDVASLAELICVHRGDLADWNAGLAFRATAGVAVVAVSMAAAQRIAATRRES